MTPRHFASGIRASWRLIERLKLGLSFSSPWPLAVDEEFRRIILDRTSVYDDAYLLGLRKTHYNFILDDHSFFQFGGDEESVRYAFYPNPFHVRDEEFGRDLTEELREGGIDFEEFSQILEEEAVSINVSPMRYEYAPIQYREFHHPCAHIHIGHQAGSRWPVARRLSPTAFTMIVAKQYYGEAWLLDGNAEANAPPSLNDAMAEERERCFHLGEEHFSGAERRLFHFV